MKIRNMKDMPVFDRQRAEVVARVDRAVIGDDCQLAYLVVDVPERGACMILKDDLQIEEESVVIEGWEGIKSYAHGEESSIYEKKIGDSVFDYQGKELGVVSDFILSPYNMQVWGLEVSSGAILDLLEGRLELPLEEVAWKSPGSSIANLERNDMR